MKNHVYSSAAVRNCAFLVVCSVVYLCVGCDGLPNAGHVEESLTAHIETLPSELKTLDEVTFIVEVKDEDDMHTTDLAEVRLEIRTPGGEWREIDLMEMDDHYMGTRTFGSSGDYELRVMGMAHTGDSMEQMHMTTVHVERAHADAGPFHIQYESEPGHLDAGEDAMLMFWVAMDDSGDPATGLVVQIVVEESDGHRTTLDAEEGEPGVYHAMMSFSDAGDAHVEIVLPGADGQDVTADFHFHVVEGH